MNTSYGINTYMAHDLNISMKTSSGDTIEMKFANHQSSSLSQKKDDNSSSSKMSFSSMQSFEFNVDSNGIDAQDQKEIDEFMKTAKPFIDDFLAELEDSAPKSPVTQLANKIADIFEPNKDRNQNEKNNIKTNIVKMFDNSMQKLEAPERLNTKESLEKIFEDTQKLLEKVLEKFDGLNKEIYA